MLSHENSDSGNQSSTVDDSTEEASELKRTALYNQLRKRTNFDLLIAPTLADLKNTFAIAQMMVQLPITVSWPVGKDRRTLLIICGLESSAAEAAQWVLREHEKADAPVLWKQRTNDCRVIHKLISGEKRVREKSRRLGPMSAGGEDSSLIATGDLPAYEDDPLNDPLVATGEVPIFDPGVYPPESLAIEASLEPSSHESTDSDVELLSASDGSKEPAIESLKRQAAVSNQLRKRTNFDLPIAPTFADLQTAYAIALKMVQVPIKVSWPVGKHRRTLLIICGLESTAPDAALWVLREHEKADNSPILWKQRTNDCHRIHKLISGDKGVREKSDTLDPVSPPGSETPLTYTGEIPVYEADQHPFNDPLVTTGEVPIVDPGEYPRESLAIEASLEPANHESTDSDTELAAGADSKEPASESLEGQAASSKSQTEVELARLLVLSQIISQEDFDEATRNAGDALTRLVEQHKVSRELCDVARECQSMIAKESITPARAVILMNYCHRTRAKFYDAIRDLNWDVE